MTRLQRNPDFNPDHFLSHYWQQKPLVIRNFYTSFTDLLEPEELAGLALEQGVESRLVSCRGERDYTLRQGPFQEADFLQLPEQDWTLLVQAVDQILPSVANLKLGFDFLPSWRVDDVMVSLAVPGGGVGPHLDQYDVFLLHGAGSRRWRLGGPGTEASIESTDSGLKLLKEFEVEQEFILECGDALYIPPGFAHWGIAEQAGLCYSMGFRAASRAELLEAFSDLLIEQQSEFERYRDEKLSQPLTPGEISPEDLDRAWQELRSLLDAPVLFRQGFGELVTQPRYPEAVYSPENTLSLEELQACTAPILRNPASRFAWSRSGEKQDALAIFVDGEMFSQPVDNLQAVISLCDLTIENILEIDATSNSRAWQELVLELINRGSLYLQDQAGN